MKNNRKNRKRVQRQVKSFYTRSVQRGIVSAFRVGKVKIKKGVPHTSVTLIPITATHEINITVGYEEKESPQSILSRFNENGLP